jgi:hypothetical protein
MPQNDVHRIQLSRASVLPGGAVTVQVVPEPPPGSVIRWTTEGNGGFVDGDTLSSELVNGPRVTWIAPERPIDATITANFDLPSGEAREVRAGIEVTHNAPPRDLMDTLSAGLNALRDGLPGGSIRLERQYSGLTPQKALWAIIRDRSEAIAFPNYKKFIDSVMCGTDQNGVTIPEEVRLHLNIDPGSLRYRGTESYEILKRATEAFLMHEAGVLPERQLDQFPFPGDQPPDQPPTELTKFLGEEKRRMPQYVGDGNDPVAIGRELATNRKAYLEDLEEELRTIPYFKLIRDRLSEVPLKPPGATPSGCYGLLRSRLSPPLLIELIWSYWHEEGMLVQSLKAISMRFQNRSYNVGADGKNPLAHLNIDPLRPLSNLVWGYIQDEYHRLTVVRRAYEYDHHYGFTIAGKAVPALNPADSRTKFLEAFHNLLHRTSAFYKEQADTTKVPDGYPLLNALRECHLLLAEGAHNQFGDLPWTARIEMLIEQWLLARPEMREFLSGRIMVPYPEPWMGAVDQMKALQRWPDGSVRHFRDLGVFGEMILLSIRYGNWSSSLDEDQAKEWAQYWRQEVQAYINSYRAVTGVDLSADADLANAELARRRATPPAMLLTRRRVLPPVKLLTRASNT